jgi:hypothetical protein
MRPSIVLALTLAACGGQTVSGDLASSDGAPTAGGGGTGASSERCDWIPACAAIADRCVVSYENQYAPDCGKVRFGDYACGELVGYALDDGTSFGCTRTVLAERTTTDCLDAMQAAADYCVEARTRK